MRLLSAIVMITTICLLSGCLANIRATNTAEQLNAEAAAEQSPYRWRAVDQGDDRALLKQEMIGNISQTKATQVQQNNILRTIGEYEVVYGRNSVPKLKEVRELPWSERNPMDDLTGKVFEIWLIKNHNENVVYTVKFKPKGNQLDFVVSGPWVKSDTE